MGQTNQHMKTAACMQVAALVPRCEAHWHTHVSNSNLKTGACHVL